MQEVRPACFLKNSTPGTSFPEERYVCADPHFVVRVVTHMERLFLKYDIPIEGDLREDVSIMCNLSQGIREDANAETRAEIIMNMYKKGFTMEQISDAVEKSIEEIKSIIEKMKMALV